ncbi:hypothetical protein QAD02_022498, partial [Eretmocerus hayati]
TSNANCGGGNTPASTTTTTTAVAVAVGAAASASAAVQAEWAYPASAGAPSYPGPTASSGTTGGSIGAASYSPIPAGAFSYPGEALAHHPTTEPVPLPTVLSSEGQAHQDAYTPSCVSMYPSSSAVAVAAAMAAKPEPASGDMYSTGGSPNTATVGYHHYTSGPGSWSASPSTTTSPTGRLEIGVLGEEGSEHRNDVWRPY